MSAAVTLVPAGFEQPQSVDAEMLAFMAQVRMVQTLADIASMSGTDHINRLHRPGAKYFNMCAQARLPRACACTSPGLASPNLARANSTINGPY